VPDALSVARVAGVQIDEPPLLEARLEHEGDVERAGWEERPGTECQRPRQGQQQDPSVGRMSHECVDAGFLELGAVAGLGKGVTDVPSVRIPEAASHSPAAPQMIAITWAGTRMFCATAGPQVRPRLSHEENRLENASPGAR
jgi:hypothetical protein